MVFFGGLWVFKVNQNASFGGARRDVWQSLLLFGGFERLLDVS